VVPYRPFNPLLVRIVTSIEVFTGRTGDMCRYFETTHSYSGCKLQEEKEDGSPNLLFRFFRRITQSLPQGEPSAEIGPDLLHFHVVTQREIIQCSAAVDLLTQGHLPPDERQCPNPTPLPPGDDAPATVGETEHRGDCTVCQAAERAISDALNRSVVVGIDSSVVRIV
jgi:hypothetical protein